jgi:hypothetical protein
MQSLLYATQHKSEIADVIRNVYNPIPVTLKPRPPVALQTTTCSITAKGLGDCVILSSVLAAADRAHVIRYCWASTPVFEEVMRFCPNFHCEFGCPPGNVWMFDALRVVNEFDCGNGHIIQQLQRALALPVQLKPHGAIECFNITRRRNRVILHFEPAKGSQRLQQELHPQPRELYWHCKCELEKFISQHPELEFIQVGLCSLDIAGATYVSATTLSVLIELISSASWFVGIMSGPLNVAVALGLRCIVVCNIPKSTALVLPTLRRTYHVEEEWQYPQNVHLHEDGESVLVPRFSFTSLEAAFNGDVYPFWSDQWLSLINDIC